MIDYDFGSEMEQHATKAETPAATPWKILIYALLCSRRLIVLIFAVGCLLGFVRAALQLNVYESAGKLLVRSGVRESATPESDLASGMTMVLASTRETVATELHLLQNTWIAERVVELVGAARILEFRDPSDEDNEFTPLPTRLLHQFQSKWYAPPEDVGSGGASASVALDVLFGGLFPSGEPTSSVIDVSYQGQNPEICRDVVDAFLKAAVDHHREVFAGRRELELTRQREAQARAESLLANEKLTRFRIENKVFDIDAQKATLLNQISATVSQIAADDAQAKKLRQQCTYLDQRIAEERAEKTQVTVPAINPTYTTFEKRLYDLSLRRMDVKPFASETDEDFRNRRQILDDQIAKTSTELSQESRYLPIVNVRLDQLLVRRDDAMEFLAALEGAGDRQAKRLLSFEAELVRVQEVEPKFMHLLLDAEQSLQRADQTMVALEKLTLMSLLDERELSNLRILQKATYDADKIGPSRSKFLMLGGMLGLAIGMTLALARAVLDSRLRRPSELAAIAACPILGVQRALPRKLANQRLYDVEPHESSYDELIDSLWSGIAPTGQSGDLLRLAFIGENVGVGCSTVVGCAGMGLAQRLGAKVIVIEACVEGPALADHFGLAGSPGLGEVLAGTACLADAIRPTHIPGLSILPVGMVAEPDQGCLGGAALKKLLADAAEGYDYVLLDMPSVVRHPEARLLLWDVDAAVIVARGQATKKNAVSILAEVIRGSGKRVLGAVFNHYRTVRPRWLPGSDGELALVYEGSRSHCEVAG